MNQTDCSTKSPAAAISTPRRRRRRRRTGLHIAGILCTSFILNLYPGSCFFVMTVMATTARRSAASLFVTTTTTTTRLHHRAGGPAPFSVFLLSSAVVMSTAAVAAPIRTLSYHHHSTRRRLISSSATTTISTNRQLRTLLCCSQRKGGGFFFHSSSSAATAADDDGDDDSSKKDTTNHPSTSSNSNFNSNEEGEESITNADDSAAAASPLLKPSKKTPVPEADNTSSPTTTAAATTTTTATNSNTPKRRRLSMISRKIRKGVGGLFSAAGFVSSSLLSVAKNPHQVWDQTQPPLEAFRNFLKTSGIDIELDQVLLKNKSSTMSLALLWRVHAILYNEYREGNYNTNHKKNKNGEKSHEGEDEEYSQSSSSSSSSSRITSATGTSSKHHHPQKQQHQHPLTPEFWNRARRYMRYATAVYGQAMIRAAEIDARGNFWDVAESVGQDTLAAISNHVGVPTKDLVWAEVDFDYGPPPPTTTTTGADDAGASTSAAAAGDVDEQEQDQQQQQQQPEHVLRHLVAIDHAHKEVVLAIRGTFSLQEIVVDIASFSREDFCGGEAHEGMATMAERLWQVAGPTVVKTLKDHPDYELVVTGHSLGAGTASLLTILLKQQQLQQQRKHEDIPIGHDPTTKNPPLLPPSTSVCCFAYASPPVFTPLEFVPQATQVITNFIHETDVVPFLSVYSVRHLLGQIRAIESVSAGLSLSQKLAIVSGSQPPPDDMMEAVRNIPAILPKKGAPRLKVPASRTIWLHSTPTTTTADDDSSSSSSSSDYNEKTDDYAPVVYNNSHNLRPFIRIHPNMMVDHFPAGYEYALEHLKMEEDEEEENSPD